jgi:hypothetical protein
VLFFYDDGGGCVFLVVAVAAVCSSTSIYILFVLCYLYAYQLSIVIFMNTSSACLHAYIVKKEFLGNILSEFIMFVIFELDRRIINDTFECHSIGLIASLKLTCLTV